MWFEIWGSWIRVKNFDFYRQISEKFQFFRQFYKRISSFPGKFPKNSNFSGNFIKQYRVFQANFRKF
ncbi:MAG: hypothetical protein CRN43_12295 [Candidatus Nephrothrix sp. EaCA]|nr:MAG: hypothetical protein CRN43_12295 [Candidatus Nephrothrix sp. EaCA]